jgi:hypothetical protein
MSDPREERRRQPRRHVLKSARINLDDGNGVECIVRNLSPNGALLSLSNDSLVPNEFDLSIEGENTSHSVHVLWRRDGNMGVKFDLRSGVKLQVLSESGSRCGMPTCRGLLAMDLDPFVRLDEKRIDDKSNFIALCPACQQLYEKGAISRKALSTYKLCLVTLSTAFDARAIDLLLFLAAAPRDSLIVSGDTVLTFLCLLNTGFADILTAATNVASEVRYVVNVTSKGLSVVNAWKGGNLKAFRTAVDGRLPHEHEASVSSDMPSKMLFFNRRHSRKTSRVT